jgi:hypothetical protein
MPRPKAVERLNLTLIKLEYAVADFNHRVQRGDGEPDGAELEALLTLLLATNRMVLDAIAITGRADKTRSPDIFAA